MNEHGGSVYPGSQNQSLAAWATLIMATAICACTSGSDHGGSSTTQHVLPKVAAPARPDDTSASNGGPAFPLHRPTPSEKDRRCCSALLELESRENALPRRRCRTDKDCVATPTPDHACVWGLLVEVTDNKLPRGAIPLFAGAAAKSEAASEYSLEVQEYVRKCGGSLSIRAPQCRGGHCSSSDPRTFALPKELRQRPSPEMDWQEEREEAMGL